MASEQELRAEDAVAPWSDKRSTKAAPALPALPGASYAPRDDTSPLKALLEAGGQELEGGRCGVRIAGWRVETQKRPILNASEVESWEETLGTKHLPEMVFGGSWMELVHEDTGACLNFNALDALHEWRGEGLPPVPIPAAKEWSKKSNPEAKMFLEYDYTFTTPYRGSLKWYPPGPDRPIESTDCHSRNLESPSKASGRLTGATSGTQNGSGISKEAVSGMQIDEKPDSRGTGERESEERRSGNTREHEGKESSKAGLHWESFEGGVDLEMLTARDPILFYDEVVLYEDELADNGVTLLTAKVRVMPRCWFVLLRFWMRVDGALFRLRDARIYCPFRPKDHEKSPCPFTVIREYSQREESVESLAQKGLRPDTQNFADPNLLLDKLRVVAAEASRLIL